MRCTPKGHLRGAVCALALLVLIAEPARAVSISWIPVGEPGNLPANLAGQGAVAYEYRIGKYEVTNSQYVEFLNAKDAGGTNALALYNSNMSSHGSGGIEFNSGAVSGSKYSVKAGRDSNPVTFVTWYDSIRFANWLNNGQGNGDTETGAYTLLGNTPSPSNSINIARNPGATIFLPSDNEWWKAAFYNPGTASYSTYPTGSNTQPRSDQPPGGTNAANYYFDDGIANGFNDGYAVTGSTIFDSMQNYFSDVGAYSSSPSFYGTFDQGGNAFEWSESVPDLPGDNRVILGGYFHNLFGPPQSETRTYDWFHPITDSFHFSEAGTGFRVASIPEPSCGALALSAAVGFWMWRRRKG
jgi:sulfatase modifying factor 1